MRKHGQRTRPNGKLLSGAALRIRRPNRRKDAGSNLVEYALVLILFLSLLFGIAGFGHMLYAYHFVSHAAREATRYAAVHGHNCNNDSSCPDTGPIGEATKQALKDYVTSIVPPGIDSSNVTTTPTWLPTGPAVCAVTATSNSRGCTVQVQVSYNVSFLFPLIRSTPLTLSSTSEMVIAH